MGLCCSKCDRYLLKGDAVETKVGDTPKLARVSHSASFSGEKNHTDPSNNRYAFIHSLTTSRIALLTISPLVVDVLYVFIT